MPQFFLKIKAELEGVKCLTPAHGNLWKFDIQAPGGGDERKGITMCVDDVYDLEGSRGQANFIVKWPYSTEQSYMKIISHREAKSTYLAENSGEFVTILAIECRNVEPTAWYPSTDFCVRSSGNVLFERVDLSDRDWAEYDERSDLTVSVSNLDYRIETTP